MEHVDNDMDDLFRKAGDLYPLKTSESDWDGVLGKLRTEAPGDQHIIPGIVAKGRNKKRRWGFLLLLIPIGLGSVIYFSSGKKVQTINAPNAIVDKDRTTSAAIKKADDTISQRSTDRSLPTGKKQSEEPGVGNIIQPLIKKVPHENNTRAKSLILASGSMHTSTSSRTGPMHGLSGEHTPENSTSVVTDGKQNSIPPAELLDDPSAKAVATPISSQKETAGVAKDLQKTDSKAIDTVSLGKITDHVVKSVKGFYLGVLAGPDWSTVKFQDIKQTGFSFGLLVGYRFNKRIAVESGFMLDKKYYYSSGEYFNQAKTNLPDSEHVIDLNGDCFMFEIPLNFHYDFSISSHHSYFANVGLSTYLMKRENYNLNAVNNNGGYPWLYTPKTYKNSTNNLFSILQLSGGYERDIGSKTKIRVEPYIKIPLQGIGISSMPISSAGIYFGIIHSFK